MSHETVMIVICTIFVGAALLGTIAMYTRQSLLVAYMLLGGLLGPYGFHVIPDPTIAAEVGEIGIIFLLFLLGLHLQPKNLILLMRKTIVLTVVSSILFAGIGFGVCYAFGYSFMSCFVVAMAMMFSSTIIGLKLLPTTILHHRHTGEVMISILLLQDLVAILVLIAVKGARDGGVNLHEVLMVVFALPILVVVASLFVRFVLIKLLAKFDMMQEYIWTVAIGWCWLLVVVTHFAGISEHVGAFIAGISLAEHPISQYIADSLKPMRDLFLVAFFFAVGAQFNIAYVPQVIIPALILAGATLMLKPAIYRFLLVRQGESNKVSWEVGVRLGQSSEFSLLLAYIATNGALISLKTSYLIQAMTIATFIVSSYWVVMRYPTPMATSARLRQD